MFNHNINSYKLIYDATFWHTLNHKGSAAKARVSHESYRLQLKRELFWYQHHPKMHAMVSDRSSRADDLTNLREISMRVFLIRKNVERWQYGQTQTQKCRFSVKKSEKLHRPYQSCKKRRVWDPVAGTFHKPLLTNWMKQALLKLQLLLEPLVLGCSFTVRVDLNCLFITRLS